MLNRLKIEEGWFTLFLVWAMVIVAAAAIIDAELMGGLQYLPFIGSVAIVTGLALAKSRFSSRSAHIMALVYGMFVVAYLTGRGLPGDLIWRERVIDLVNRQFVWLGKALSQGSSRDGLIFVIHTSAVFWFLGYTAAWFTFRRVRIWRVILPSGLVLLSVIYYYYGPRPLVGYLVLYGLIALVYIGRIHLVDQEREWRQKSVRYERRIRFTFLQASVLASVVALGMAWGLPAAQGSRAVNDALGESGVNRTWRGFQENWQRLFASIRSYGTGTNDAYSETLSLGGPRTPGSTLIMDVWVENRLPFVYWQGVVYDTYEDGRWSISESNESLHLPDEGDLNIPSYGLRQTVNQTVVNYVSNAGTIYSAPEPINSDLQMYVTGSQDSDGRSIVNSIRSRFVLKQGDAYQVASRYSIADATSLRNAGTSYPDWVLERYLQVPETITNETVALAEELTRERENPFDKTIAVRDFLRTNIAYNDQISAPPDGVEPIHYTLFASQEAYCVYYASAMTMMLRSQGIPARFVGGYAQGEWRDEANAYRVRSGNSHTWVEVFFPNYGWVQFEPTASIPIGERPETSGNPGDAFGMAGLGDRSLEEEEAPTEEQNPGTEDLTTLPEDGLEEEAESALDEGSLKWWQVTGALMVFLLAVGTVFMGNEMNRRVESSVEKSYARLASWSRWLGVLIRPAHTPYERANLLSAAVPKGRKPLRNLTHHYVRTRFSREHERGGTFDSRAEWKVLRPAMIRRTIAYQIEKLRNRSD